MTPHGPTRCDRRPARGAGTTLLGVLLLGVSLAGCATSARERARTAEQAEDFDVAVVEYTRAVQERPDDRLLRQELERAKLRSARHHYTQGRRYADLADYDEALLEYQLAAQLHPASTEIRDALRSTQQIVQTKLVAREAGLTELEALVARARTLPPVGLELPDATLPDLVFRDASIRVVFSALGQFADINVIFDPAFVDDTISIDLSGTPLTTALTAVAGSTRNFYRVTAEQTVTVIPDTPAKRREYEEEVVQTFYLSNADVGETIDLLRLVVDIRRLGALTATRAISIKDTPARLAAAARLIAAIDKARPEVVIEVELLEVDRQRFREYGLQFASPGSPGIDGFAGIDESNGRSLADLGSLTGADVFVGNLPGLFYRLLKQDSDTRTLANPHLRTTEGQTAQAHFGEEVPVPVTTFAPIATGGIQQQPITSFNYKEIGVNIDITPYVHHDGDVSLDLSIEVSNISGTGFGGLPSFGSRSILTTIRLHDGETNILAGLIRDDERVVMEGIPGLSDLPIIGRLFARNKRETQETDIIVTLTPRIVRGLDLTESDLRAFRVERDTGTGLNLAPPVPAPLAPGALRPNTGPANNQPDTGVAPIVLPPPPPPQ